MSTETPSLRLILTMLASEEAATALVRQLLEERLIACGTILPQARSLYRWQGTIEESEENVLLLKTEMEVAPRCIKRLAELHPYEVPEIVLIHPEAVEPAYAQWVKASVREN
jgi:periplasmic divalent cation tolerance protein